MAVETRNYTEFSSVVHETSRSKRVPLLTTVEVTRRCPLECLHCYNNLPMADDGARHGEMTLEEHKHLVDQLVEAGCMWILYTGGEIFARRDFLDIYHYARQRGMIITLFTNGTMITEKIADYLAEWRPFAIEITLYGRTKETYEALTGIPGSYEKCMRGISLLMERKLPLALKTVGLSTNKHEIFAMRDFAAELGVDFKFDSMVNPRIDCSQSPLAVRLTPREIVDLDIADGKRMDGWQVFADDFLGPSQPAGREDQLYHCGGGINSMAVDPAGAMSICVLSHQDTFDLRSGSFEEGWDHFLHEVRTRKITRVTKCTDCHLKSMCGMCPANGELENGDPESPVDFLCHVAHLRATVFGFPIASHGECEYCPGGEHHEEIVSTAADIAAGVQWVPPVRDQTTPAMARGCSGGCNACAK